MAIIQLPGFIYTGMESLLKIFEAESKKILIFADTNVAYKTKILDVISKKAEKHGVRADFLTEDNPDFLLAQTRDILADDTPEIIVAVGSGKVIDCAAAVSCVSGIPFYAVPRTAPTALWESDEIETILNRKIPSVCILDPDMIISADSGSIAYEGLGMLTLCAEGYARASDRVIKSVAETAFLQIYNNLFDSYNSEISARENLLEGMYWGYLSYVNSYSFSWESPCYRLCEFFKNSQVDSMSLLAVSCVQIFENILACDKNTFNGIAREINSKICEDEQGGFIVDKIRQLRAKLSVPLCVRNLGVDEDEFLSALNQISEEDKTLFEKCFYNNFGYKRNNTVFVKC